jgi:hypothetical protein
VRRPNGATFALGSALLIAALLAGGYVWGAGGDDDREARVAERGAKVMPFDLDRTTHVFRRSPDGGVQTVVADDPADGRQVALVREHLHKEAEAFRRGDFDDPMAIHGEQMPGLAALRASAGRIEITYEDVPSGGRIRYETRDAALVAALHAWFEAQVMDHGAHAEAAS